MPASKKPTGRAVTQEDREAIGKVVEVVGNSSIVGEFYWLKEKYRLQTRDEPFEGTPIAPLVQRFGDARHTLFPILLAAFRRDVFHRVLSEVLMKVLPYDMQARGTESETSQQMVIRGVGHWGGVRRALQLLGYEWTLGKNRFNEEGIVVLPIVGGEIQQTEVSRLRTILSSGHPAVLNSLQSAYTSFLGGGSDGSRQACEASRNAFENLVRDFTGKDLSAGIDDISPDDARRTKVLKAIRDFLALQGTHASDQPGDEDAYLAIRLTEEVLVWILKRRGEW